MSLHFSRVWKICILKKTSNGSNFGWLIRQMSINQNSGRQTFRRRFVSGSLFVSPCPPECYLQSETKIEPDLRLMGHRILQLAKTTQTARALRAWRDYKVATLSALRAELGSELCIGQIEASTCPPPPGQPPGHLTSLKIIVQIRPHRGQNAVQMPHTGVHLGDQMPPPRGLFTGTKMTEGWRKRLQLSKKTFINITKTEKHC